MLVDGGDYKHFVKDLFRNYHTYVESQTMPLDFRKGSRSYKCVYEDFNESDKKKAKSQFAGVSPHDKHTLPFTEKSENDDKFIARKHGREKTEYKIPELKEILDVTYGCIVYQEQVMRIVQDLAGYTLGQADMVRRMMGKKQVEKMMKEEEVFINGREEFVDKDGVSIRVPFEIVERK